MGGVEESEDGNLKKNLSTYFFSPCPLDLILEEPSFDPCYPIRAVRGH